MNQSITDFDDRSAMRSAPSRRARRGMAGAPWLRERRGKVLVLFVVALPMLFVLVGLVVDGGRLLAERRRLQQAADAAASSAARRLALGRSIADARETAIDIVRVENGLSAADVAVHVPPVSGDHAGLDGYVQVELRVVVDTYFMQVLRDETAHSVVSRATAGIEPATAGAAVVVLDPAPPRLTIAPIPNILPALPALVGGLEVLGLGAVRVDGAVLVNNAWGGMDEDGNPVGDDQNLPYAISCTPILPLTKLRAADIRAVGGVDDRRNYGGLGANAPNPLRANRLAVPDPYSELPVPTLAADSRNVDAHVYGGVQVLNLPLLAPPVVLKPGVYDWIHIVTGPVTFQKGVYIIRGVNPSTGRALSILAGPVAAEGVMFYITDSPGYSPASGMPDSGDGEAAPSAPGGSTLLSSVVIDGTLLGNRFTPLDDPASPYDGILIFQRRTMRSPIVIVAEQLLGNNGVSGVVYAKWGHVIFGGHGTFDARFVVGTMRFLNVLDCRLAPTRLLPPARDVFLVE